MLAGLTLAKAFEELKSQGLVADVIVRDHGDVAHVDACRGSFRLKNAGSTEVTVLEVTTSCGCTDVSISAKHALPGETVTVGYLLATTGKSGNISSTIRLTYVVSGELQMHSIDLSVAARILN